MPRQILNEPAHGSVVLVNGDTGTAWQRFFSDGLWHSTTGKAATWAALACEGNTTMKPRNLIVIHDIPSTDA